MKPSFSWAHVIAMLAMTCVLSCARGAEAEYDWSLPPGFPTPVAPDSNPMSAAKVELGCRLFFEPRLSVTGSHSCASCHRPDLAFTDGRAVAVGATGSSMTRGAMSLANVAYNPALTWGNDRLDTLEAQMEQPLFNEHPVEMGLKRDGESLTGLLRTDPSYVASFRAAFAGDPQPASMSNMIKAIAAFERTLISGRSAFDRYVYDDERDALSPLAKEGMALFYSERIGCGQCHGGLTFNGAIRHRGERKSPPAAFASNGSYRGGGDTGLEAVSGKAADRGRFRVPTLRNVAVTAPYMHDGSLATLADVIDHYDSGGGAHPEQNRTSIDPAVRPLHLTEGERAALSAFLHSLTDHEFLSRTYSQCSR